MIKNVLKKVLTGFAITITNPFGAVLWLIFPSLRKQMNNTGNDYEKAIEEHEKSNNEYLQNKYKMMISYKKQELRWIILMS